MSQPSDVPDFTLRKRRKLERVRKLIRSDAYPEETHGYFDCLTPALRRQLEIVDTENVSANEYDGYALQIIDQCRDGLVLDCGAGKRSVYYDNVVNLEIVAYDTTDVLAAGEALPFIDASFDAVFSLNVLEHVKYPFRCAEEISRVLKPGGRLYCVVPFLQPVHAYPHHYYNMSAQGLRNLFDSTLSIDRQEMIGSGLPIWSLCWIIASWADGLTGSAREHFLASTLADFLRSPLDLLTQDYVAQLSDQKNFELASTTALFATKAMQTRALASPGQVVAGEISMHRERDEWQARALALRETLEGVMSSRSWRLTRPLRWLSAILGVANSAGARRGAGTRI